MCCAVAEEQCPLCRKVSCPCFFSDQQRDYHHCDCCGLIFVAPDRLPSPAEELKHYQQHQNDVDDGAYRSFLRRLLDPLMIRVRPPASGLDFGCGPGPALAAMCREAGFSMSVYDPYFAPDPEVLQRSVQFITATEVLEHLHDPGIEIFRLWKLLKPRGWFGIMTKRWQSLSQFETWYYRRDPTHVSFYSDRTFEWLALQLPAELTLISDEVVLLQKH